MSKWLISVLLSAMLMAAHAGAGAEGYVVVPGGAKEGSQTYTDRAEVYQKIPDALQGADYVQMRIEDRFVATPSQPLLELTLSKPATVYVGVDSRGEEPLSWLSDWEKTGQRALATSHLKMELYAREFPAGKVVLNGAKVKGAAAMYVVFATDGSIAAIKRITSAAPAKAKGAVSGYDRMADPHNLTVFMQESGYCWFQDPRVIVHDGKLIIGAVQGNGTGAAHVGVYDLEAKKPLGTALMQDNFDHDDHNSPAFHIRPDGSILSVYAKHQIENTFYYRISEPDNPLEWSDEMSYQTKRPATYANLYEMKNEGKLYNFFRGIRFNPTFVTSTDGGKTWGEETHFIASELDGTHRPYVRYAGNGTDTVFISFTDGHPRNVGNSLYYAEFRDGKFWRADGTLIKDLKMDGPLRPSEAEVIYRGSGKVEEKGYSAQDTSVPDSAWTSSIVTDAKGYPHIGYSVHKTSKDHRYRIASWDGKQWHDREVAYGGSALYGHESSYTGLISLDPLDPRYVVISTDVDPFRGTQKNRKHEIYRAKIELTDANTKRDQPREIVWEPLTWNSPVSNLRPIIVRDGDRRVVLWNRGVYRTYSNYQLDAVGFVEAVEGKSPIAEPLSKEGILEAMKLAKDFQERGGVLSPGWIEGTFYGGVFACYQATGNEAFLNAARQWTQRPLAVGYGVNADPICTAQTYLDVYKVDQDEALLAPVKKVFENEYFGVDVLEQKKIVHSIWKEESRPFTGRNLWWWCDALYMAPPVMARMGQATGDRRYFDLLHELYWDSTEYLYNPEEQLFFRDARFFDQKTPGGKPVFWGRGNGWVIGGLVRTIDYIPEDDPMRGKYIQLFQEMMARIVTLQGDDGLWRSSLNEPSWQPMPESSGSGFFVFGLAAGVNRGWLDRETYQPAAEKGWKGLVSMLSPQGKVQWSQPVAAAPYETHKENTRAYTQGAFLLAAAEMYRLEGFPKVTEENKSTFARYIPERADDFAWENDKIAFRAYGPALRKGVENSGIDCWLKRVDYPIIDKWYGQMDSKSYHVDWGEGYDPYHVGSSAGCGGTGIWLNGKREPLETYTTQEVLESTPQRTQFKLTYERTINGDLYGEEKTITIELGKRLFEVRSVFTKNGKVASGLPICIGLTTHEGKAETYSSAKQGWIACWEKIGDSELGTGVVVDPARIDQIKEVESDKKDESHLFILMKTDNAGAIHYKAGYGWEKAGEIQSIHDWTTYLSAY